MRRRFLWILLPAMIALLAILYVARKHLPVGASRIERPDRPLNVLLITIDTIRPDRLSCYGGTNPTPNLDRLAARGLLFVNAYSQVPLTFPSHTSILTGLFPIHHGMHQNGQQILSRPELVITRSLRARGYHTGAVVASFVLDRKFGLAQDFDEYDDRMERLPGIHSNFDVERPAGEVTDAGLRIIEHFAGNQWFVWLHYYDPHTPYAPPAPLEGYDGEVQYVDQQIGRLLEELTRRGLDRDLAIAVTGDHGESLGDHGEATHGFFIYNSTVHVPMILAYPNAKPARISATAATVDIAPTLLELAAVTDTVKRDGQSLLELATSGKRTAPFLLESRYPELLGWNRLEGIIEERWKLISTTRSELYDLASDPSESSNLFAREERASRGLKQKLAAFEETAPVASGQPDAETLEKLKSLGYISTTSVAGKRGTADPKDKIAVWSKYERILQLKGTGRKSEALEELQQLVHSEPDNPFLRTALAGDYRAEKRPADAVEHLQAAIRVDPSSGSAFQELALTYRDLRNFSEALRAAEAAIAVEPDRSEFHSTLGLLCVDTGSYRRAEQEFTRVLKIDPNNAVAWNNLGNALRAMQRPDEAAAAYRKAIELSPHYAYPLNGLATIYAQQNKASEAIPLLEKALDLDPQFVEVYLNLAIAFDILGEQDKARTLYKTFLRLAPDWMKEDRTNAANLLRRLS